MYIGIDHALPRRNAWRCPYIRRTCTMLGIADERTNDAATAASGGPSRSSRTASAYRSRATRPDPVSLGPDQAG
jgi:hypothetical protein